MLKITTTTKKYNCNSAVLSELSTGCTCCSTPTRLVSKLKRVDTDNTALVGCIEGGQKLEHRNLVRNFFEWSA